MFSCVFRVDASVKMGSGHVMRCLTLADALARERTAVTFICRELPGNMCRFIEQKGYSVYKLSYNARLLNNNCDKRTRWSGETWQKDAKQTIQVLRELAAISKIDWLIVDHYGLDMQWEQQMRPYIKDIMAIDDLANRHHDCDLLLDQNLYLNMQKRYEGLIPQCCQTLLGPQYAILRPEFYEARKNLKIRDGIVRRMLVFFGGSDPTNETTKALKAIQQLHRTDIHVDVIVGAINPHKEQVRQLCAEVPHTNFCCQVSNMAELMSVADLAIGAGGTTTWERCFLGLPTIILILAKNQQATTEAVAACGAAINMGWHKSVDAMAIEQQIRSIIRQPEILIEISKSSLALSNKTLDGVVDIAEFIMGEHRNA